MKTISQKFAKVNFRFAERPSSAIAHKQTHEESGAKAGYSL
jgi:hypothetical protein